jgi:hypothetical protein
VQQPFGHDTESHTHCPAEVHSRPVLHALHAAPAAPHDALDSPDSGSHVELAVQQPGHELPPQAQAPPEHASPVAHGLHAAPPVPHWVPVCAAYRTHAPVPSQHPPEHDVASHVHIPLVAEHSCPLLHAAHAAPAAPHCIAVCDA